MEPITLKRQLESTAAPQGCGQLSRIRRGCTARSVKSRSRTGLSKTSPIAPLVSRCSPSARGGFLGASGQWQTAERLVLRREYPRGRCAASRRTLCSRRTAGNAPCHLTGPCAAQLGASVAAASVRRISVRQLIHTLRQIDADMTRVPGCCGGSPRLMHKADCRSQRGARRSPSLLPLLDRLLEYVADLDDLDDDTLHPMCWPRPGGLAQRRAGHILAGAAHGLFVLHWDVICPICRRAACRVARLSELPESALCPSCDIAVPASLHDRVAASFAVASSAPADRPPQPRQERRLRHRRSGRDAAYRCPDPPAADRHD